MLLSCWYGVSHLLGFPLPLIILLVFWAVILEMDLINKSLAWVDNFCRKFESILTEVDDFMFKHVEEENGSQVDLSSPTLDEFLWPNSFRQAGETNDSKGDVSPPTSEEVAGFKFSAEAGGSSNFLNAETNPSGISPFPGHSPFHNALNNPAASGTESATHGVQASIGIAVSEPSASTPEIGKSEEKKCAHVAEPGEAAVQAPTSDRCALLIRGVDGHSKAESDGKKLLEFQALETSLVMVGDEELLEGPHAGGPNQQKNDDIWESEWVIV